MTHTELHRWGCRASPESVATVVDAARAARGDWRYRAALPIELADLQPWCAGGPCACAACLARAADAAGQAAAEVAAIGEIWPAEIDRLLWWRIAGR